MNVGSPNRAHGPVGRLRVAEMSVRLKIPRTTQPGRREGTLLQHSVSDTGQATELMKEQSNQERVKREIQRLSLKKRKELSSRERVRLLQLKLYLKAKQEKSYKFYILYDKLFLTYVLEQEV